MKRRVLSTIIALLLVAALLPMSVLAASYTDTDGHWAESSIERWSDAGVVQGTGDAFAPDSDLTCAQLATILAKLLRLPAADDAGFSDNLADAWYYDAINRCAAAGILNGYADGTVRPNETISRVRAMVMLARALGIEAAGTSVLNGYADAANVPDWARGYVAALLRAGIVSGVSGSRLAALADITRAQFVTILDRAIAIYADEDGATVKADDVDGIIVVVAEDVQIKDAPAGTKVVAAASAKSLKVNGKSVDANDIHIVPETVERPKSVGHAHSHSYDATTHKCSCGAVDPSYAEASVNGTYYLTLQDAVNAGGTVKLTKDVTLDTPLLVTGTVTLDLNGKTISNTSDLWDESKNHWSLISVRENGDLTITGNGTLQAKENDCYAIDLFDEGVKCTIENGTFVGNLSAVYVYDGALVVHGGDFSIQQLSNGTGDARYRYTLNCLDESNSDGTATITVTGGTFAHYDPSNSASENPHGNFVPDGYTAFRREDGSYRVIASTGKVEVTLSELGSISLPQGPKAEDEASTTFTVDLDGATVEPTTINYSEHATGHAGPGVMIGSTDMNHYAAKPAGAGDYQYVIKGGTINGEVAGYSSIDGATTNSVYMLVPGNSDVTFEDVTFNGVVSFDIQKYTSPWSHLNAITFKNCTFNGIIVGTCPASNVTFDGCTFNDYTNSIYANNSNPIWWRADYEGEGGNATYIKNFTFVNNRVTSTRPVKIERVGRDACNPVFTFQNNYFDISAQEGDTVTKNMAINIGQWDVSSKFTLIDEGNRISGSTASLYTAALDSGSNQYIAVPGSKVLDGSGNEKVITAMVWKTTTDETFEIKSID